MCMGMCMVIERVEQPRLSLKTESNALHELATYMHAHIHPHTHTHTHTHLVKQLSAYMFGNEHTERVPKRQDECLEFL